MVSKRAENASEVAKDIFIFQLERNFKLLLKNFLELLEDNYNQHEVMIQKIKNNIPKEYHLIIDNCNYLNDNRKGFLRKKVLDGNDRLREMEDLVDKFEFGWNGNK